MDPNKTFSKLADEASIAKTAESLRQNGAEVFVVDSAEAAKEKVLSLVPSGAEVMTMSSQTLEKTGLSEALNKSPYLSVKEKLARLSENEKRQKVKEGAAPEWAVGSVHAVTEDGSLIIASNTGSQLPAYVFGADHVIWVVGTQKIVENFETGLKRIREYTFPLEDERLFKAFGVHSGISKLLIFNKEIKPGRITVILVKENLGF